MHTECLLLAVRLHRSEVKNDVLIRLLVVSIAMQVSQMLADIVVIVVTWLTTHRQAREVLRLHIGPSASAIMLADGELTPSRVSLSVLTVRPGSVYFL